MQEDLFENEKQKSNIDQPVVSSCIAVRENEMEWRQFCRLGEMMGDGLHYEADGKWIAKEYRKLAKLLIPELREQDKTKRKLKAVNIDEQMTKLLAEKKCSCGGVLKQKRSGAKVAYCEKCNARYVARGRKAI